QVLEREVGAHEAVLLAAGRDALGFLERRQIEPLIVVAVLRLPDEQPRVLDVTRRRESHEDLLEVAGAAEHPAHELALLDRARLVDELERLRLFLVADALELALLLHDLEPRVSGRGDDDEDGQKGECRDAIQSHRPSVPQNRYFRKKKKRSLSRQRPQKVSAFPDRKSSPASADQASVRRCVTFTCV